ncbi:MAG: 16S rRNA (guanine(527)-N(7))-methyltransferase RsmG [Chloroflexota bacterium]|nr:16S rRNA (guanine(527)-N(7))-methyltransferase RsmG [Chloroflexota bacterium]
MTEPTETASQPIQPHAGPEQEMALLRQGALELGLELSDAQLAQFQLYYHELVRWNDRFNLTAITGYADVQTKHFLDSLAALPLAAQELGESLPPTRPLHLVDVGSGAGFPGIPLKIAAPRLKVTLMDGTGKKVRFLGELISTLGLNNAGVVHGRAEELGRTTAHRGQYDLVAARAVAPLNTLVEYLLPLVRRGGLAVVYKGGNAPQEFVDARKAIETLGGDTVRFAPVEVPFLDEMRYVLLIKKVRHTPDQYPRGQGLARKQPLS